MKVTTNYGGGYLLIVLCMSEDQSALGAWIMRPMGRKLVRAGCVWVQRIDFPIKISEPHGEFYRRAAIRPPLARRRRRPLSYVRRIGFGI